MVRVRVLTVCYLGNPALIIHNLDHGHRPAHSRHLTTAHTAAEVTFLPDPATTPATTPQHGSHGPRPSIFRRFVKVQRREVVAETLETMLNMLKLGCLSESEPPKGSLV